MGRDQAGSRGNRSESEIHGPISLRRQEARQPGNHRDMSWGGRRAGLSGPALRGEAEPCCEPLKEGSALRPGAF